MDKKLSEIGRTEHYGIGDVIILTANERRELVRRVWEECLRAVLTIDDPLRNAATRYYKDWIKEQEL